MPLLPTSFEPPYWLKNGDIQTIYTAIFRKVKWKWENQKSISTPDGDRLDVFSTFQKQANSPLLIISHGIEGDVFRPYVKGLARAAFKKGYSVMSWNMRGCGTLNLKSHYYHSGLTIDLLSVVHLATSLGFHSIFLAGFSLGGNLTLKFMGEHAKNLPQIKAAAAISPPCDLAASSKRINQLRNRLYEQRFLKSLKQKIKNKTSQYPSLRWTSPKSVWQFDEKYTAPLFGYKSALHYYQENSSIRFLELINKPTYILQSFDDTFISHSSIPKNLAQTSPNIHLETTIQGGHCAFLPKNYRGELYSEQRILEFFHSNNAH